MRAHALPQTDEGETTLYCCYMPTNHVYVGDVYLLSERDIIRNNLSGGRVRSRLGGGLARPAQSGLHPHQLSVLVTASASIQSTPQCEKGWRLWCRSAWRFQARLYRCQLRCPRGSGRCPPGRGGVACTKPLLERLQTRESLLVLVSERAFTLHVCHMRGI